MQGLGVSSDKLSVYIENRPMLEPYQSLNYVAPLAKGDIANIVAGTSNHWRKIFNVYAKLVFTCEHSLSIPKFSTWQQLRDEHLLQAASPFSLIFSKPELPELTGQTSQGIKIITGFTYAQSLNFGLEFETVADVFLVSRQYKLIVCPYFDYRQLSNKKIEILSQIIKSLSE